MDSSTAFPPPTWLVLPHRPVRVQRDNLLSLAYASRQRDQGLEPARMLARELDAVVEWSDLLGRYLLVSRDLTMTLTWNHLAPVERAEGLAGAWDGEMVCGGLLRRSGTGADRQPTRRRQAMLRLRVRSG